MSYRRILDEAGEYWMPRVSVERSGGPERIKYDDEPDPNYRPRPAGFTAANRAEVEPLTWDGDNA